MTAESLIKNLELSPHPEGGFYKETYRAAESIDAGCLPGRFGGSRSFATAIYFLLQQGDFSAFHKIKSDECWHFYAGGTLHVHIIYENKSYQKVALGPGLDKGEVFQFVVPAGAWFASEPAPESAFSFVGCTVAPGFDFNDFEMARQDDLLRGYPQFRELVSRLCRL